MKVTALEEYGLRCMLLFVEKGNGAPLTIPEIGASEKLSIPYAGKLLMILKQAGLVRAVRGRKGGYMLYKPPPILAEFPEKVIFERMMLAKEIRIPPPRPCSVTPLAFPLLMVNPSRIVAVFALLAVTT